MMCLRRNKLWVILLVCFIKSCATTRLTKTESEYHPVSPVKLRLNCSVDLPKDRFEPKVTLNFTTEKLYQKTMTEHYVTSYKWRNRLFSLVLTGVSVWATINWWDYAIEDTSGKWYPARVFGLIGAVFGFLAGTVGADEFPSKPKYWKQEVVIASDTIYKDPQPLSKATITLFSSGETKGYPLKTDEKGKIPCDIREFYTSTPKDSNLIFRINYEGVATKTLIPRDFVNQVRDYETEAKNLFTRAQNKEEQGKYEEALADYNLIKGKYPVSQASKSADTKIESVQRKLVEKKIAEIRKRLQRVSELHVRGAIIKLGLDEYQNNALANAIENLSSSTAVLVMKEGLGIPLSDDECVAEYRKLALFQKFYAVVCYLRKVSEDQSKEAVGEMDTDYFWGCMARELNTPIEIVTDLVGLKPENLLKK